MTTDTKTIREEIARKGPGWAAQEIAWLRRMLAVGQSDDTALQIEVKPQCPDQAVVAPDHRHR